MREAAEQRLYERLTSLPLFQGMSRSDMEQVISQTRFGFCKFPKRRIIKREGDPCDRLFFLLHGVLSSEGVADDHGYSVLEKVNAPAILQPERLFGLTQRHTRSFTTFTACDFLTLEKAEVVRLSDKYMIFRLNLLNIVSTLSQRLSRQPWHKADTTRRRIIKFFADRCDRPAGEKEFHIKMVRLAEELCVSRLDISSELNKMQDEGLLTFSRGIINIPHLEQLR